MSPSGGIFMKKSIFFKILVVLITILTTTNVSALYTFPNSTGNVKLTKTIGLSADRTLVTTNFSRNYSFFGHKQSNELGSLICTSGLNVSQPTGKNCTLNSNYSFSNYQAKGIAYIINTVSGIEGGTYLLTDAQYYWAELLINEFLGTYSISSRPLMYQHIYSNNSYKIANGLSWQEILQNAKVYANSDTSDTTLNVSTNTLTFSQASDGYYYSNNIYVSGNYSSKDISVNNNNFKIINIDNNNIQLKIAENKLSTTQNVTVTITASKNPYYVAEQYYCGSSSLQNLTPAQTKIVTPKVATAIVTGSVKAERHYCEVVNGRYYDNNGNQVSKSKYEAACFEEEYYCEVVNGKYYDDKGNKVSKSKYEAACFEEEYYCEVVNGKYYDDKGNKVSKSKYEAACFEEEYYCEVVNGKYYDNKGNKVSKSKYEAACFEEKHYCEIYNNEYYDKSGNVVSKSEYEDDCFEKGSVTVTKLDENGNTLEGAKIQLLNKNNEVMYEWISTTKPYTIQNLEAGTYKVKEVNAPNGYVLNDEAIEFEVYSGENTEITITNVKEIVFIEETVSVDNTGINTPLCVCLGIIIIGIGLCILTKVYREKSVL